MGSAHEIKLLAMLHGLLFYVQNPPRLIDGRDRAWLHFRTAESGCVFGAVVCKIKASKCYIKTLPLVTKDKRSCISRGERSTVQLPLDHVFALWK